MTDLAHRKPECGEPRLLSKGLGKLFLHGRELALGGADGAAAVLGRLVRELAEEMAFAGIPGVDAIPADLLVPRIPRPRRSTEVSA